MKGASLVPLQIVPHPNQIATRSSFILTAQFISGKKINTFQVRNSCASKQSSAKYVLKMIYKKPHDI